MKWKTPDHEEERLIEKLALFPITINGVKIWFESYWELQRWNSHQKKWYKVTNLEKKEDLNDWKEKEKIKEEKQKQLAEALKKQTQSQLQLQPSFPPITQSYHGVTGSVQAPPVSTWHGTWQNYNMSTIHRTNR